MPINYSPAYSAAVPSSLVDATVRGRWDYSMHVSAVSRWNNWYVEAVKYHAEHPPYFDGLYLVRVSQASGLHRRWSNCWTRTSSVLPFI